ncbi:MAG: hypothetical protein M9914_11910 [Trueperaceae bacterium]|nr:hypothetical protein [Trueperaceae bacterium]
MMDVWEAVAEKFPGIRLESEIQGWAFLEQFEEGVAAYSRIPNPSPKDDRWVGVCHFQLLRDSDAIEVLERAAKRGEDGAHVYLAHVLPFVDRGDEASSELELVRFDRLSEYDKALFYRISSIREESGGNLREALRTAEEGWKRIQGIPEYNLLAPSILSQLAILHGRIGRLQRALWFVERGLVATAGAEHLKTRVRRSALLVSLGRYREAQLELDSVDLAEAPDRFQAERHWLLGEIALANGSLSLATQRYLVAMELAIKFQFTYEEFLCRLPLVCILGSKGNYTEAFDHLMRAQTLISDKSDRLIFRFREVLLNYWAKRYTISHALQEFEGLMQAFGEMGLLQEEAAVRLHHAELLRLSGIDGWQRTLDDLEALSVSLQNQALLAREWTLVPELRQIAARTHPRIAGPSVQVLEVFTLGDERMLLDDAPVHIPLRRGIELMAYFLEFKAVSLQQILNDVFHSEKPSAAKSYFHQFRHQLREALDGVEIEYDAESRLYRLKSEIDVLWDVSELRAGRVMGETGIFLPSSDNQWAYQVDQELDKVRITARKL